MSDAKQEVRERVWAALDDAGASRFPGARGRIPNFAGAADAAERLASLDEWGSAETVKANPDSPQLPVRARALTDGKTVYMAVPKLKEPEPFLSLDPSRLEGPLRKSASIKGASQAGRPVAVSDVPRIDLVVCGTVAVNPDGVRVGKGGGYSDIEFALLQEVGRITDDTLVATTVHPLQVLDTELPEAEHDFRVDLIVTPDEAIRPRRTGRPPGILWDHLDDEKIASIPTLAALAKDEN